VEAVLQRGVGTAPANRDLPYTSRAKKSLELAMAEARRNHHRYVGTEHLLLGLAAEGQNIAAKVLEELGADAETLRPIMLHLLHERGDAAEHETGQSPRIEAAPGHAAVADDNLIERLGLQPHPEGGHYRELYRSGMRVAANGRERSALTTIYYYLKRGEFSRWHVVQSDEIWHVYAARDFELLHYDPFTRVLRSVSLGSAREPSSWVYVIPAGHWQAGVAHDAALMGCSVAPGFEFSDFSLVRDVQGHEAEFVGIMAARRVLL
jgi:predicted cupin superfamily sugar epimerase